MYLRVSVSGSKVWKFDYRLDGKDCSYTLGRFPDLSINDARQRRNDAAKLVASGIHPKAHEQQLQLPTITHNKNTFWTVCEDWIEDNRDRWSEYYFELSAYVLVHKNARTRMVRNRVNRPV